ncbi:hypothetical protein C8Q77DRAFT_911050 [Trametes polyzona]|nr:hypothetical protein C8Q77DRAFT_911050 [Trametes polyzona]
MEWPPRQFPASTASFAICCAHVRTQGYQRAGAPWTPLAEVERRPAPRPRQACKRTLRQGGHSVWPFRSATGSSLRLWGAGDWPPPLRQPSPLRCPGGPRPGALTRGRRARRVGLACAVAVNGAVVARNGAPPLAQLVRRSTPRSVLRRDRGPRRALSICGENHDETGARASWSPEQREEIDFDGGRSPMRTLLAVADRTVRRRRAGSVRP